MKKLIKIQSNLNCPKVRRNAFGNYNYRSAEDIMNSLKPHLKENECTLILTDDIVLIGTRFYVKATATISDGENEKSCTAFAREDEDKKGMDKAQVTGSVSSYARKYALNGLFLIDDSKDSDAPLIQDEKKYKKWIDLLAKIETIEDLTNLFKENKDVIEADTKIMGLFSGKKNKLK